MENIILIKFDPRRLFVFDNGVEGSNTTTTGDITAAMRQYYDTRLIKKASPKLVYHQFAVKRPLPAGNSQTIVFHGWEDLDTTPGKYLLTEGVTPSGQKLTPYDIVATVQQYGNFVELTDLVITTAIDDMVATAVDKLSGQAAVVLDKLTRNELIADSEVGEHYQGEVATGPDEITKDNKMTVRDIKLLVARLRRTNAPTIDGKYPLVLHPDCSFDLSEDPEYKDRIKYAAPKSFLNGFIGELEGARLYESTNVKITKNTAGVPIYHNHITAEGAYATVALSGGALKTIIKQLGSSGTADPLDQRGTAAWKASTVTKVLIPEYIIEFICTASITPDATEIET